MSATSCSPLQLPPLGMEPAPLSAEMLSLSCSASRLGRQKGAAPCTASEACSIAWSGECGGG
eukprot:7944091-Lingulodinium_polyedra.AAC.1